MLKKLLKWAGVFVTPLKRLMEQSTHVALNMASIQPHTDQLTSSTTKQSKLAQTNVNDDITPEKARLEAFLKTPEGQLLKTTMAIQQLNQLLTEVLIPSFQNQRNLVEKMTQNLAISECLTAQQKQEKILAHLNKIIPKVTEILYLKKKNVS